MVERIGIHMAITKGFETWNIGKGKKISWSKFIVSS
jgi:hypothetical protein